MSQEWVVLLMFHNPLLGLQVMFLPLTCNVPDPLTGEENATIHTGASLVDQYPIMLVHIVGFKTIKN